MGIVVSFVSTVAVKRAVVTLISVNVISGVVRFSIVSSVYCKQYCKLIKKKEKKFGCHATGSCLTMGGSDKILFLRCQHSFRSSTTRVLTRSYIDNLFWSKFWLASDWGIRNLTPSKTPRKKAQKSGFSFCEIVNNRAFFVFWEILSSCHSDFHRINATHAFVSPTFRILPKMPCHCFSLIPLRKFRFQEAKTGAVNNVLKGLLQLG